MFGILLGAAFGIAGAIAGANSRRRQTDLQREQLELQKQQYELEQKQYYDSMTSQYYSYMDSLEQMRSEQSSAGVAINQAREDIASNQLYLDRWRDEYDNSVRNSMDTAFNAYAEQASALGMASVSAGESGKRGGSAALVSGMQERNIKNLVGDSLQFNLKDNPLASYINAGAQDLLAERQTAMTGISTGYESILSYQEAMKNLGFSIEDMQKTTSGIKEALKKNGRFV